MLILAAAAFAATLDALVPTSGTGAEAVLDGDPQTRWTALGSGVDEGILLRFAEPVKLTGVELAPCNDDTAWTVYADGTERDPDFGTPTAVRSLYFRSRAADACLADVVLRTATGRMLLSAPRQVAGTVTASSTLAPIDAYHVAYLFDSRIDFGWVEGAAGAGEGQSVTVKFAAPVSLTALQLWNGYQRSADHLAKNARAAKLQLTADNGVVVVLDVGDAMGPQRLALPSVVSTQTLTLTVLGATKGSRWEDLVLSELRFEDAEGSFGLRTPDLAERSAALLAEVAPTSLAGVVDQYFEGNPDSANGSGSSLKLRSNHTFVAWSTRGGSFDRDQWSEVFDGTWVVTGTKGPWTSVQLYGRRRVTSVTDSMYASAKSKVTDRVSGGTLRIARLNSLTRSDLAELEKLGLVSEGAVVWDDEPRPLAELPPNTIVVLGEAIMGIYMR